ncbi:MAG: hypothetical protein COU67_02480 [Candidatus Pacebacteria bacterium CG10_big_fil_rev_8_21_14_0_10_44_54]|nr:MAG: hypothetical protein COU67_02480 [Candidatus Pacebacteria bacterium CG10_big_fil_rev_8_21_14_0_10_44_54]
MRSKLLREKYGVTTHEITREQFGTDSYTLYGGPPHYPYWSANDWALMPSTTAKSTLILRQTITDPVYNYGDQTSSYTSQPNDYSIRNAAIDYFLHLFLQAHNQAVGNGYTFAMLGIENSLEAEQQQEFFRQLDAVREWQKETNNFVVTVQDFYAAARALPLQQISVYGGVGQSDPDERAWWVTTPKYRVRLRLSGGVLSITDLRIYDERFSDPYLEQQAKSMGWWITPFVLDGSRSDSTQEGQAARNDVFKNRPESYSKLNAWELATNITDVMMEGTNNSFILKADGKEIISFFPDSFATSFLLANTEWLTDYGEGAWGLVEEEGIFTTFAHPELLVTERQNNKRLLFPELQLGKADGKNSNLYINNRYAISGRNPVRLVFFPKDEQGYPVLLRELPSVSLSASDITSSSQPAHGSNGMIFIDVNSVVPMRANAVVSADEFSQDVDVYLAPNCAQQLGYCLTHPIETYWYIRAILSDKLRFLQQQKQFEEQVFD